MEDIALLLRKTILTIVAFGFCFLTHTTHAASLVTECVGCNSNQMKTMAENEALALGTGTHLIQVGNVLSGTMTKYRVRYEIEGNTVYLNTTPRTPTSTETSKWSEYYTLVVQQKLYEVTIPQNVISSIYQPEGPWLATSTYLRALPRFSNLWVARKNPVVLVTWSDGTSAKMRYVDYKSAAKAFVFIPGTAKDENGNPISFQGDGTDTGALSGSIGTVSTDAELDQFFFDAFAAGVPIIIVGPTGGGGGGGTWECDEHSCVITVS